MNSDITDLLYKIASKATGKQFPLFYQNEITFEVPNEDIAFKVDNKKIVEQVKATAYNENKNLFEGFKQKIYSNFTTEIDELTNDVYISIKKSDDKNCLVEILFND